MGWRSSDGPRAPVPSGRAGSSCRALHFCPGASDLQTEANPHRGHGGDSSGAKSQTRGPHPEAIGAGFLGRGLDVLKVLLVTITVPRLPCNPQTWGPQTMQIPPSSGGQGSEIEVGGSTVLPPGPAGEGPSSLFQLRAGALGPAAGSSLCLGPRGATALHVWLHVVLRRAPGTLGQCPPCSRLTSSGLIASAATLFPDKAAVTVSLRIQFSG